MRRGKALRLLVDVAPAVFEAEPLRRNRCILATAVGIAALRELGVAAEPLSVRAKLVNPAMVAWLNEGAPGGRDEAVRRGCWLLETEKNEAAPIDHAAGVWNGHLVVSVPDAETVLDLDLQQMRRPQRGMNPPPAAGFVWPRGERRVVYTLEDGCVLGYEAQPEDRSFERAPDWWRDSEDKLAMVAAIVRAVRAGGR